MANDLINRAYVWSLYKNSEGLGLEHFQVGEHVEIQRDWWAQRAWKLHTPPTTTTTTHITCSLHPFHLDVPEPFMISFYDKSIIKYAKCSSKFLSCSSKLIQPKQRGLWAPLIYSRVVTWASDWCLQGRRAALWDKPLSLDFDAVSGR